MARAFQQFSRFTVPYQLRDVQLVLGLAAGLGQVQRPRAPGATGDGAAGLHELRHGDVDDALTAGLGAGDADQAVDLAAGTLACGPGELVAEQGVDRVDKTRQFCYAARSAGLPHFWVAPCITARLGL